MEITDIDVKAVKELHVCMYTFKLLMTSYYVCYAFSITKNTFHDCDDDVFDNDCQVLVVVDGPMVRYHGKGVRHYVLTLMHIVSSPIVHGVSL